MPSYPATNLVSLGNLVDAAVYLGDSTRGAAWASVDPDSQSRALITATRVLERQRWEGTESGLNIVATAVLAAGGASYAKGAILTVQGGTSDRRARVEVTSVSSGVVTGVRLIDAGIYTGAIPSSPAATASSGAGTGCTLTITQGAQVLSQPRSGMTDRYGTTVSSTIIQPEIEQACFELAFLSSQGTDIESSGSTAQSAVKRVKAGSVEVENFSPGAFVPIQRFPPEVMELIGAFLAGSGGTVAGSVAFGAGEESQFDDCDLSDLTGPLG